MLGPRECLQLQVACEFLGTFGCHEHEMIASVMLLKLAIRNHWQVSFVSQDFTEKWTHSHTGFNDGSNTCSFDRYVTYTNEAKTRFTVNQRFIDNVQKNKSGRVILPSH